MTNPKLFVITLFVPQTRSEPETSHPLIDGFVKTVCTKKGIAYFFIASLDILQYALPVQMNCTGMSSGSLT